MTVIRTLLYAFALFIVASAANAEVALPLPAVEKALAAAESVLKPINVSNLFIQYQEGKYIENARSQGIKYVELARRNLGLLQKHRTLQGTVLLALSLRNLESQVDHLTALLANANFSSVDSRSRASEWAVALINTSKPLADTVNRYEDALLKYADRADEALQRCPQ